LAAAGTFVVACAEDVTRIGDNSGGSTVDSGGTGGLGAASDISGTWDLYGSSRVYGWAITGTLTIDATRFLLTLDSASVNYIAGSPPSLSYVRPFTGQDNTYTVTKTDNPVDLGVIPLDVGGTWTFTRPGDPLAHCDAQVGPGTFGGRCSNVWYAPSSLPDLNHTVSATRTTVLPSVFGELGGVWQLVSDGGSQGRCTARFEGSELIASCNSSFDAMNNSTLVFTLGDGIASGSSDEGLEISAVRR
jgi:hypothetical protein